MVKNRAAIYARFSSHNQRSESIEIQVENSRAYCEREGLQVDPLTVTRFVRIASAASLRVLKMRTAHRYLSSRTSSIVIPYLFVATAGRGPSPRAGPFSGPHDHGFQFTSSPSRIIHAFAPMRVKASRNSLPACIPVRE